MPAATFQEAVSCRLLPELPADLGSQLPPPGSPPSSPHHDRSCGLPPALPTGLSDASGGVSWPWRLCHWESWHPPFRAQCALVPWGLQTCLAQMSPTGRIISPLFTNGELRWRNCLVFQEGTKTADQPGQKRSLGTLPEQRRLS